MARGHTRKDPGAETIVDCTRPGAPPGWSNRLLKRLRVTLNVLANEVREDRERLRAIADSVGAGRARLGQATVSIGEMLSRAKTNGRLVRRSPLSDVLEIESLISAVRGKRAGWEGMLVLAMTDSRFDAGELHSLLERADDQLLRLAVVHEIAVRELASA